MNVVATSYKIVTLLQVNRKYLFELFKKNCFILWENLFGPIHFYKILIFQLAYDENQRALRMQPKKEEKGGVPEVEEAENDHKKKKKKKKHRKHKEDEPENDYEEEEETKKKKHRKHKK